MAEKDAGFLFLFGVSCLTFLQVNSMYELYSFLSQLPILIVYHPTHDEEHEKEHVHAFFPCPMNRTNQKIQLMLRLLDKVLKGVITNRYCWNEHLKKINVLIDFNAIESVISSTFGFEGFQSNAGTLTDSTDKITRLMVDRLADITAPLDQNCLEFCDYETLKRLHLASGNVTPSYFGEGVNDVQNAFEFVSPPSNEGTG